MDIGNRIEMFVDHAFIDKMDNCSLKLNPPIKKEKVITFDKPWESETSGYLTVLDDNGILKLYYRGRTDGHENNHQTVTCYAFSDDGKSFHRPKLTKHKYNGIVGTNIILRDLPEAHNFAPFIDTCPGIPANERYKAVGGHERSGQNIGKLYGLKSSNGVDWERYSDEPIITDGMFDSQNVAFYDNLTHKYRCYARYTDKSNPNNLISNYGIRAIESFTSSDFLNWDKSIENKYDVPIIEEFYTNATIQCPGAEHFFLSFPKRYIESRNRDFYTTMDGVSDAVFMSSRDGVNWNRTFMEAWVRPGLDRRNWINRNNMPAYGIIDSGDKEFSMYISENYRTASNGVRRLAIRKFGFASVNAGYKTASFTTKPFTYSGDKLEINFSTSAAGHIKVTLMDHSDKILAESGIIYGDEIFEKVDFNHSIIEHSNTSVKLRFEMKDADLYALKFGEQL